ncbi:Sjogren's syndrome/scleroderma autoantigen 1 family protein [[Eubacterium] cellulosolvens]
MSSELKRMSEMLKSGATMLSKTCPECGSPLFQVGKDIICAKCNKKVVIVRATEKEEKITEEVVLSNVKQTVLSKIKEVNDAINSENDKEKLILNSQTLSIWLDILDKIRKIRRE